MVWFSLIDTPTLFHCNIYQLLRMYADGCDFESKISFYWATYFWHI